MNKYIFLLLVLVGIASCSDKSGRTKGERLITVTIEPLRYFTERIAGDRFGVRTMVASGSNPETYEPTARQMVALSQSAIYIKVGNIGFERTWLDRLKANAPHTVFVDSSEGITLVESSDGIADPHTWMSTVNSVVIARNIYKSLVATDPKDSIYFKRNLDRLVEDIADVDKRVRSEIAECESRSFLIYHPILTYFARDYKLRQIAMEEEGREPSASQLGEVIDKSKSERVRTFFVQKEFANKNADIVVRGVGARKEPIDPLGYDWCEEMVNIARKLR